jgi:hypothetical protein
MYLFCNRNVGDPGVTKFSMSYLKCKLVRYWDANGTALGKMNVSYECFPASGELLASSVIGLLGPCTHLPEFSIIRVSSWRL